MTSHRYKPGPIAKGARFRSISECRSILKDIPKRRIVFVVCESDEKMAKVSLSHGILECLGASDNDVMNYPDFFAANTKADMLILKSSRILEGNIDKLKDSLVRFRRHNPNAAVILCPYADSVIEAARPLLDEGTINALDNNPPGDLELIHAAHDIFEKLKEGYKSAFTVKGKNFAFITDGANLDSESRIFRLLFKLLEASPESRVAAFNSFFANPQDFSPDVLILRSSKLFFSTFGRLERALKEFRNNNPSSVVILSLVDLDLLQRAQEFKGQGLVNHIDVELEDDFALMDRGLRLLH
jgi:hypothetical protein